MSDLPILKICIPKDNADVVKWYDDRVNTHNNKVLNDPFPDSGFDLCVPNDIVCVIGYESTKVDLQVKATMQDGRGIGFYTYPRSSISKTPLILANHVGIIDSGYRGNLIAMFRNTSNDNYHIEKYQRLIQICHPSLTPFIVKMVDESELETTSRGTGGFGSTGN